MKSIAKEEKLLLTDYEKKVASLYDVKKQDINYLLGQDTGLIHHHFGIGKIDMEYFSTASEAEIMAVMHRLENDQTKELLAQAKGLDHGHKVFDGGSGRAGTAVMFTNKYQCQYHGATISSYQYEYSKQLAQQLGREDLIHIHLMNMIDPLFDDEYFDYVVTNETTMYALDLLPLFRGFHRILKPKGRYLFATWAIADTHPLPSRVIDYIDRHYVCKMHTVNEYLQSLMDCGFQIEQVNDYEGEVEDYWKLRNLSEHKTGIEDYYLEGYRVGAIKYHIIRAIKI